MLKCGKMRLRTEEIWYFRIVTGCTRADHIKNEDIWGKN
jgi:hypothetical protein